MKLARAMTVDLLKQVLIHKKSLNDILPTLSDDLPERNLIQAICYGVLRFYWQCDFILKQLTAKPIKDKDIHLLLLIGIYQLKYLNIPPHAATSETVAACQSFKKTWAKGLTNAVLRNYLRQKEALDKLAEENTPWDHPVWLVDRIRAAWPNDWQMILKANNQQAPMTLRVNHQRYSDQAYLTLCSEQHLEAHIHPVAGIMLKHPTSVFKLPGFDVGSASVQDASAQLAATLLEPKNDHAILDACAAPGGKTGHLLELAPKAHLTAIDIEAKRLEKIKQNLSRLNAHATLLCADASKTNTWANDQTFDRILCDAPCSATGVIRRHPDIKHLRKPEDIAALANQQGRLLTALWPLLKSQGILLYCTCSILPEENDKVIAAFLEKETHAVYQPIDAEWGRATQFGRQILPGENNMDGFYYCCLKK